MRQLGKEAELMRADAHTHKNKSNVSTRIYFNRTLHRYTMYALSLIRGITWIFFFSLSYSQPTAN